MSRQMFVYIMANERPTLYTGVTNSLLRRVLEHKQGKIEGFTKKYNLNKLIYYETGEGQLEAIVREKQIKNMNREEKLKMIKKFNPTFRDLFNNILEP